MLLVIKQKWNLNLKQNEDFELIPSDDENWWNVRILKGEYTETIFRFGTIAEVAEKDELNFNFQILSSPIDGLTEDECAEVVGEILYECMTNAVEAAIEREEAKRADNSRTVST
jgi:hypothetical protein